jgi:hypothetical protein
VTSFPEVVCADEYAESTGPSPSFKVIFIFVCVDGHCGGQAKCVFSLLFLRGSNCLTIISGTKMICHKYAYNPERIMSMFMMISGESAVVCLVNRIMSSYDLALCPL